MDLNNIVIKYKAGQLSGVGANCGILERDDTAAGWTAFSRGNCGYDTVPELLGAVNAGEVDYLLPAMLEQELQNQCI